MFACVIFSHEGQQSVFASSTQYTNTNTSCAISSGHRVHENTHVHATHRGFNTQTCTAPHTYLVLARGAPKASSPLLA